MNKTPFPQTDFPMSKLSLGTLTFGSNLDEKASFRILDIATEAGINSFDTAELYPAPLKKEHYGISETIIGRWLKGKDRSQFFISSKIAGPEDAAEFSIAPWVRGEKRRCHRQDIKSALHASLKRLQTDYLDLYMVHWPERKVSLDEKLNGFSELIEHGVLKAWGTSNEGPINMPLLIKFCQDNGFTLPAAQQLLYNLLHREPEDSGMKNLCLENNIAMVIYSPLSMGALTGKYRRGYKVSQSRISQWPERYKSIFANEQAIQAAIEYEQLAAEFNLSLIQLSMAWLLHQPISSILLGVSNEAQLDELIKASLVKLPQNILDEVERLYKKWESPVKGIK